MGFKAKSISTQDFEPLKWLAHLPIRLFSSSRAFSVPSQPGAEITIAKAIPQTANRMDFSITTVRSSPNFNLQKSAANRLSHRAPRREASGVRLDAPDQFRRLENQVLPAGQRNALRDEQKGNFGQVGQSRGIPDCKSVEHDLSQLFVDARHQLPVVVLCFVNGERVFTNNLENVLD